MAPQIKPSDGSLALELERRLTGKTSGFGPGNAGSTPAAPATWFPRWRMKQWQDAPEDLSLAGAKGYARGWNDALQAVPGVLRDALKQGTIKGRRRFRDRKKATARC